MPILLVIVLLIIGVLATHSMTGGLIWLGIVLSLIILAVIIRSFLHPLRLPQVNEGETPKQYKERAERIFVGKSIDVERERDFTRMSWQEFEVAVQKYFDRLGYATIHRGKTGDQGVDIEAYSTLDQSKAIIQCKHHIGNVGSEDVQKLAGAMLAHTADKAFLVTSGGFTDQAYEFASMVPGLTLISGKTLAETWEGVS